MYRRATQNRVVSADTIRNLHAIDIVDVGRPPNAQLRTASSTPGCANFFIRGIGNNGSVGTIDPAVNVIVDGMVYDYAGGTVLDTFDTDVVEVLRGKQGILFGKNSTGGAVSIRSKRPTSQLEASAEFTAGTLGRIDAAAMVSGPIAGDTLLGKLAVITRNRSGIFEDHNGGTFVPARFNPAGTQPTTSEGRTSDLKTFSIRPTLAFEPADNLKFTLFGEYTHIGDSAGGSIMLPATSQNIQALFGYTPPAGKWENNNDFKGFTRTRVYRAALEAEADVGAGIITSVTGYRRVNFAFSTDVDGTPFTIFS